MARRGFRAPEATLDWRSDIYALGALLQFVLPQLAPAVALAAIMSKAMSADAGARYPDVTAMLTDIGRYEDGLAVTAWREPALHGLRRFWSRNAVLLLWLLTAYAAVKLGLFFLAEAVGASRTETATVGERKPSRQFRQKCSRNCGRGPESRMRRDLLHR